MTVRDNVAMAIMFGRARGRCREARRGRPGAPRPRGPRRTWPTRSRRDQPPRAPAAGDGAGHRHAPAVLLLDEALAGLNPAEIDNAVEVVRRIHRSGITIVIVEHLLRVVNQLATRIVVLDQGRLLADGEPADGDARPGRGQRLPREAAPMLEVRDLDVFYGDAQALWGARPRRRQRRDGLHRRPQRRGQVDARQHDRRDPPAAARADPRRRRGRDALPAHRVCGRRRHRAGGPARLRRT